MPRRAMLVLALTIVALSGCDRAPSGEVAARPRVGLAIRTAAGTSHAFRVERAVTEAEQREGLMFRGTLPDDGGMLFAPYPADGGKARIASFWMKDTPSPLDIIFIAADGTIDSMAENTAPYTQTPVSSIGPVTAVLELRGGRAAELGIDRGDRVSWDK